MLNKILIASLVLLTGLLLNLDLRSQTSEWKVVWDKNPAVDSVDYYVIYRNSGSTPSLNDSIGWQAQPTNGNPDSVLYLDQNILPGIEYFYRIQAVDYIRRRSNLSQVASASIPKILIKDNLTFPINSSIELNLNQAQYILDPDNSYSELTWSVSGGQQISININSANLATITTPPDSTGPEIFTFTVMDPDGFFESKEVTISLTTKSNNPPVILSRPIKTAIIGELYEYEVVAEDPNGDQLTFTLTEAPPFLSLNVISNSVANLVGMPGMNDMGDHPVSIYVEDENFGSVTQKYTLTVREAAKEARVFPIPYNVNFPNDYGGIYFELPSDDESYTILIYNVMGDLIYSESQLSNSYVWKVENSSGKNVNAGIYIYYIKTSNGSQIASGKLVIIR